MWHWLAGALVLADLKSGILKDSYCLIENRLVPAHHGRLQTQRVAHAYLRDFDHRFPCHPIFGLTTFGRARSHHRQTVCDPQRSDRTQRDCRDQPTVGDSGRIGHSQIGWQCDRCSNRRQRNARFDGADRKRDRW